ncbi:hypothetical protein LLH23_01025 [bacterium]|nr:hypothetical protein [bacterium]
MAGGAAINQWELRHPFTSERSRLLLVEGQDEWHLLVRVLPTLGIADVDVRSFGGNEKLAAALKSLADGAVTGFDYITSMGIVRDAEAQGVEAASQSVVAAIRNAGFPEDGERRINHFILPNDRDPGCFEDICLACVSDDPARKCVDDYAACLATRAAEGRLTLDPNPSKTRIHAFLASREDATIQIGQAFDAHCWDMNHEAWQPLIDFIKSV